MTNLDYYPGETNGLLNPNGYFEEVTSRIARAVYWDHPGLKITRLRLLSDPGFPVWDVSYCHGQIGNEPVEVELPFSQLPKRSIQRAIVAYAKRDKVFAKGTGIFDCISKLI